MADTYVVNKVTSNAAADTLIVEGTVDGVAVIVNTSLSGAGNNLASAIAFENFIAPLMLKQYNLMLTQGYPSLQGLTFIK